MQRRTSTAWGAIVPPSFYNETRSFEQTRGNLIENIYINIPEPLIYDSDGRLFSGRETVPERDNIDTLLHRDLQRLAREAGRRSRPPPFTSGYEPGTGNFIRISRSAPRAMSNYFLEHPEIYGSILDRQGEFSTDEFWRNTHGGWLTSMDANTDVIMISGGPEYRASIFRERIGVPEIEMYDAEDGESDIDPDENDYCTFSFDEVADLIDDLELVEALEAGEFDGSSRVGQRVGFHDGDNLSESLYDTYETFGSTSVWDHNSTTRTRRSRRRRNHRSATPPPHPEDDDGNGDPHWMVRGFEADYIEGWSGDEAHGENPDSNPEDQEDQADESNQNNDDNSPVVRRLSEEFTQMTLEASSTTNPQSQENDGQPEESAETHEAILLEGVAQNQESPAVTRILSVANDSENGAMDSEQQIVPGSSNPETS
ncbi:hypothetical protein TWF506_006335 [Arthrobotrys conoides]|uniref:Uncharacterized protein n=1 Tax=Arthrobotrys conoides TaxID=74498 RepID=A0AAN8NRI8_9PEZI